MSKLLSFRVLWAGVLLCLSIGAVKASEPIELYWEDLVPPKWLSFSQTRR